MVPCMSLQLQSALLQDWLNSDHCIQLKQPHSTAMATLQEAPHILAHITYRKVQPQMHVLHA